MVNSRPPICWESFRDKDRLQITSSEASKVASVYCYLESKVASTSANSPEGAFFRHKFEILQLKLKKLKALNISWIGALPGQIRFSVNYFCNLEYLQIEGCPSSSIFGSFNLHLQRLKKFSITDCVGLNLSRLLLPWKSEIINAPQAGCICCASSQESEFDLNKSYSWRSLSMLRLSKCGLTVMDNSLHYLPAMTDIDFSNNDIPEILNLQDCYHLDTLNLSHNSVRSLSNISDVLANISSLNISHNHVDSLEGIEKLYALRALDVSHNHICDFHEISYLAKLPCLESLHLLGNPLSMPETKSGRAPGIATKALALMVYRKQALMHLIADNLSFDTGKSMPIVDNKPISNVELQTFRSMVSIDILTDLNECCSAIIERSATRRSPPSLSLNLSQAESYYSSPSGTWCNSRTNSPTMLRTFFKEEPSTNTNSNSNNLSLEWSRTNSPIEECSRTNSPISTTHNNSGKESRSNNSHIFSFSSQKKISSTWNYSRNSSPTGNQQTYFFDEGIVDEIGKRRRGSGIIRMERLLNDDDMGDVIFSLQKLKENLHIAERRLSIK